MASGTLTRNSTLPDTAQKADFHNLIDTATVNVSSITGADISTIEAAGKTSCYSLFNTASLPSYGPFPTSAIAQSLSSGSFVYNNGSGLFGFSSVFPTSMVSQSLASGGVMTYDGASILTGVVPRVKVGQLTRDMTAATGNVSYTGVGFRPKAVFAFWSSAVTEYGFGLSDGTTEAAMDFYTDGTPKVTGGGDDLVVQYQTNTTAQSAILSSFDVDGFTLEWTRTGTTTTGTLTVRYLAIG